MYFTYINGFPFCVSPQTISVQLDFQFLPSKTWSFSIAHAKRQLGGHSCQLPMRSLLSDEDERCFLGWVMGTPHGTARPPLWETYLLFHPPRNFLLTGGLIRSVDTISCSGLRAVVLTDSTSIKRTSERCCVCLPDIHTMVRLGYLWHPLPLGRGWTGPSSAARLEEAPGALQPSLKPTVGLVRCY